MKIQVKDVMADHVITATPHETVGHVRGLMASAGIHAIPVVGPDDEPVGIITSTDLLRNGLKESTPVGAAMTEDLTTVPIYESVSTAARIMRHRKIHHLVVVHEKKLAGILSSFDVLEIVENHRFVPKEKQKRPGRPRSPKTRKQGRHRG